MRYVVIGASAAGISGAKTLRELDKEAEIILVSKDEMYIQDVYFIIIFQITEMLMH